VTVPAPGRLFGRTGELDAMRQLIANVRSGQSAVLVLRGEAGGFALPDTADLPRRIEDQYLERLAELPEPARRLVLLAAAYPVGDSALILRAAQVLGLDIGAMNLAAGSALSDSLGPLAVEQERLAGRDGGGKRQTNRRGARSWT
jgi:hypothetical protein